MSDGGTTVAMQHSPLAVAVTLTVWLATILSGVWVALNPNSGALVFVPGVLTVCCWVAMARLR